MNNVVILAEKPSQAQAYAEAFPEHKRQDGYYDVAGEGYNNTVITYGFGHLVELYNPDDYEKDWKNWNLETLPIFPENYKFKVSNDKKKQYNIVKSKLDNADEIIVATDSDREGEAIARLIIRLSGNQNKPIKRLWINSLEKEEIKKGFQNLKDGKQFYTSFIEAESRQIADWLVGINLSRLYTLSMQKNGMEGVFSIGRVQTPTLYLIYKRNKEIENFVSKPFYELYALFSTENGTFKGKYKDRFDTIEEIEEFINQHNLQAEQVQGSIEEVTKETKLQYAPKLFSLSDLQSEANKKYNLSASDTLKIAQSLYEKKITSYPRSDSNFIGTPEFNYLKDNLDNYLSLIDEKIDNKQLTENKRYVDSKKVQEHYAIIPTKTLPDLTKLSEKERKIYELILYRTLSIFETPYKYEQTTILTNLNNVIFKTTGKVEIDKGYRRLYSDQNKDENNQKDELLPDVSKDMLVQATVEVKKGDTQPPKYYTEGTLLTAMKNVGKTLEDEADKDILKETEGIGTEATRASIIEGLKQRGYITTQSKNILVTDKGITLCEVIQNDPISNAEMTAKWENYLSKIRSEEGSQDTFLQSIKRFIEHTIQTVPNSLKNSNIAQHAKEIKADKIIGHCPNCQNDILDKGKFYGCSNYPECHFSLPKKWSSKTLPKKSIQELLTNGITSPIKGFKSKKGNSFTAKLKLTDEYKLTFDFDEK